MEEEDENVQYILESNIVYTSDFPCAFRNQRATCVFNSILQGLSSCSRIVDWVSDYLSESVKLENASFREIFGWRSLRTVEDTLTMQYNQLTEQGQLNIHSARFSLPSCMDRNPKVDSWCSQCGPSSNSGQIVNWVDDGVMNPSEFLWSIQEEKWSDKFETDQYTGQSVILVLQGMFDAITNMEDNDVSREIQKTAEPNVQEFHELVYGVVECRRTCTNPECDANAIEGQRWCVIPLSLLENTTLEVSIQKGMGNNIVFGNGLDCPDCLTKNGQKIGELDFEFPPLLFIMLNQQFDENNAATGNMDHELWNSLNERLYLYDGLIDQPDNEKKWMTYRTAAVITRKYTDSGSAHGLTYINRDMEGLGPTWTVCDDEIIDILRPDEVASFAEDNNRKRRYREFPWLLIYERLDLEES